VEPSASEEFEEVYGAKSRSVLKIPEDSSTETMYELSKERRLCENSIY
jgi:hypothetical protein